MSIEKWTFRRLAPLLLVIIAGALGACQTVEEPPPLITTPPSPVAFETLDALLAVDPPERDLVALAQRLQGAAVVDSTEAPARQGDTDIFNYIDETSGSNTTTSAELRYQSDILNLWFEEGARVSDADIREAAAELERQIVPTTRATFGTERQPGIDNDARINVLHLRDVGGSVAGYFSSADASPAIANPFSNEREMLYINLRFAPVGSDDYFEVIAHELQHMVHWSTDSNETTWLDEGMAELSAYLSGYPDDPFINAWTSNSDTQLTDFSYEDDVFAQNYGASFLFALYLLDRFGEDAVRAIVEHPANGAAGINAALADLGHEATFDALFADWVAAAYFASRDASWETGYRDTSLRPIDLAAAVRQTPDDGQGVVSQFGVDYLALPTDGPVTVFFTGTQQTQLLSADPLSGSHYVTTFPADDSDLTLTRAFDLTGVPTATLIFQNWYEIEDGWDYGYVLASADNGATWDFLTTIYTTTANPYGNGYGPGLTGNSGRGDSAEWAEQRVDLSPYAGGEVLVRFEYITDDAVYEDGWAIDEIAIPEIGYAEGFESGLGGWEADGFVRHTNRLPQTFLVQVLRLNDDGSVSVERLPLSEVQNGTFTLDAGAAVNELVLAVSGTTPVTSQPAPYLYRVTTDGE